LQNLNESGALDVFLMLFVQIDFLRTPWSAVNVQNILKILALSLAKITLADLVGQIRKKAG